MFFPATCPNHPHQFPCQAVNTSHSGQLMDPQERRFPGFDQVTLPYSGGLSIASLLYILKTAIPSFSTPTFNAQRLTKQKGNELEILRR